MNGKNVLIGTALYLATIFVVYGQKAVTYKDEDQVRISIRSKF